MTMKKIASLILLTTMLVLSLDVLAQSPPPPPSDPSANNNLPVGGTAPIGSGLILTLALGAVYGIRKNTTNSNSVE